jgi:LysM repeat protein
VNSLKPLILLTILGGVGFGVYRTLNKRPDDPPPGVDTSVTAAPEIKLGDPAMAAKDSGAKNAGPNMLAPEPGSTAPAFQAAAAPGNSAASMAPPFSAEPPHASQAASSETTAPDAGPAGQAYASPPSSPYATGSDPLAARSTNELQANGGSPGSPPTAESFATAWTTIEPKLAAGQLAEALKDLTAWYNHPSLTPAEQEMTNRLLNELAGTVVYSGQHLLAPAYRVLPGDTLADIAQRHRVTPELLAKINGLESATAVLEPGREIKVLPGPFSATIDVARDRLTLTIDGCYAGSFSLADFGSAVAQRAGSGTPVEFTVSQKTTAPIYNGPNGEIEAEDPANPLGQYLVALGGELAIHGTNPQATAPVEQPTGGIRLSATDIVDVYDILTIGSRVIVRK